MNLYYLGIALMLLKPIIFKQLNVYNVALAISAIFLSRVIT